MTKVTTGNGIQSGKNGKEPFHERLPDGIPDFEKIENSSSFRELMRRKKRFLIPTTILFLGLYLLFNIVISYTDWLNATFIGDITWVWVFAFGLFAMTWILVTIYMKRAAKFDEMAKNTLKEFEYDEEETK
ncbi:hypothetical protein A1A1_00720 [Planococcus antarcticus DSM 14505]|uniref:DUF485 domain-containing protein n=1 Tax=Planococcus antarcticus DSM 14505 TaxID=1185653 RepID=A0AA87IPU2_9BACL|nr:DUF485 domain-containing protein [Planococcus antarcticus]EIM08574.1 hypothetical protein A1A1_00720 [Planococcus antarcticus DSM 14505]